MRALLILVLVSGCYASVEPVEPEPRSWVCEEPTSCTPMRLHYDGDRLSLFVDDCIYEMPVPSDGPIEQPVEWTLVNECDASLRVARGTVRRDASYAPAGSFTLYDVYFEAVIDGVNTQWRGVSVTCGEIRHQ